MVSLRRYRFSRQSKSSGTIAHPLEAESHEPKAPENLKEADLNALHSVPTPDTVLTAQPGPDTHTTGRRYVIHIDLNIPAVVQESGRRVPESVVVREFPLGNEDRKLQPSPACQPESSQLSISPQAQTSNFAVCPQKSRQAGNSSKRSRFLAVQTINSEIAGASPCYKSAMRRGSKVDVRNVKGPNATVTPLNPQKRKQPSIPTTMERMTSCYKGVGKHVNSKQWEAHIWRGDVDQLKRKKGRGQLYLGAYPTEMEAAKVHDMVALKRKKKNYALNFDESTYAREFSKMESLSERDYIRSFRRKAQRFTRGTSVYKGVSRQSGGTKWEGRIGYKDESTGKKMDLYLGVHPTEVEAARAVDMASLHYHGWNDAITNFAPSQYNKEAVEQHLQRLEKKMYNIPAALLQYWSQFQASS